MTKHCSGCASLLRGRSHVPVILERIVDPQRESEMELFGCVACGSEWTRSIIGWVPALSVAHFAMGQGAQPLPMAA